MTHRIEWFIDRDTVVGRLHCDAPGMAPCRIVCSQGCEIWPCHGEGHEPMDNGCNAVEWMSQYDPAEFHTMKEPMRPLVSGPVHVWWDSDAWIWGYDHQGGRRGE